MMDDYKQLHLVAHVRRHAALPYLWRGVCTCGWYALAASEARARMGLDHHISSEEPFPDIGLSDETEAP